MNIYVYNINIKLGGEMENNKFEMFRFRLAEGATHINIPPTKVKFGFTLAEVLITLGVIGVVAAMTIPTLMANHQKKQTVVKLQKAISVMNQAYRLAYDDVGEATPDEARTIGAEGYFNKFWAPYLKTSSFCNQIGCGYDMKGVAVYGQPWKKPSGAWYPIQLNSNETRIGLFTMDNFFYLITCAVGGTPESMITSASIFVDINGTAKPNVFGRDVFVLERKIDGEKGGVVLPSCSTYSDDSINVSCSKSGGGGCCAEKIKRAGWRIDKSYPWK